MTGSFSEEGVIEGEYWKFDKAVQDFSLQIEINYLKYILGAKKTPYTSYVTAGIGVVYFPYDLDSDDLTTLKRINIASNKGNSTISQPVIATTIPFGIGFKYTLGQRLGIGIEYQMRKMFSDKLDNLDDPLAYINIDNEEITYTDMTHNNDWSGYLGIHLTYKIYIGKRACPAYESKN